MFASVVVARSSELTAAKAVRSSRANCSVKPGVVAPAVADAPGAWPIHWKSWGHRVQRRGVEGLPAVILAALVRVEDVVQGVLLLAVSPDLVVEMGAIGAAGQANLADDLTADHLLT